MGHPSEASLKFGRNSTTEKSMTCPGLGNDSRPWRSVLEVIRCPALSGYPRGHDEQAVLTRLEAGLQRYPQPHPPPQAASQGEGWCAVHNCTMQENVKHGQRWFSHKKEDGSWCK